MVFLVISILLSVGIIAGFKLAAKYRLNNHQLIASNYISASLLGFVLGVDQNFTPHSLLQSDWIYTACFLGVMFIGVFYLFAQSAQKAGVALTAVASRMSVIIPATAGMIIYGEKLVSMQWVGLLLAFPAMYLSLYRPASSSDQAKPQLITLPLLLFLGNGINDTLLKYAEYYLLNGDGSLFLAVIFTIAGIIGLTYNLYLLLAGINRFHSASWGAGFIFGIINYGTTYFLLWAMDYFPSAALFPMLNVGIVLAAGVVARVVFHENLSAGNWFGMILALISIILFGLWI